MKNGILYIRKATLHRTAGGEAVYISIPIKLTNSKRKGYSSKLRLLACSNAVKAFGRYMDDHNLKCGDTVVHYTFINDSLLSIVLKIGEDMAKAIEDHFESIKCNE